MIVVIGSVVVSWVNVDPYNSVVVIVRKLTDPVYYYIKKYLPFVVLGGLDLSPLVVIIILQFLKKVIIGNIYLLAEDLIRTQM
jgi:YggT family protein